MHNLGQPGGYAHSTATRRKVAGIDVVAAFGLVFWLWNSVSSSLLEIFGSAVLFRRLESVHRGAVVFSERVDELRRRRRKIKGVGVAGKDIFSVGTPAAVNRSMTLLSTPQVIGLTKPSGGGGE